MQSVCAHVLKLNRRSEDKDAEPHRQHWRHEHSRWCALTASFRIQQAATKGTGWFSDTASLRVHMVLAHRPTDLDQAKHAKLEIGVEPDREVIR